MEAEEQKQRSFLKHCAGRVGNRALHPIPGQVQPTAHQTAVSTRAVQFPLTRQPLMLLKFFRGSHRPGCKPLAMTCGWK